MTQFTPEFREWPKTPRLFRDIAITSLSLVEALYTVKELAGDEPTKQNIQAVIDMVHSLRPTI
ncbi:hypothetical protein ABZ154_09230 [Streptomyces sp. NPDC006261]|uniref:hypothetical protein n=1 Tax=Streptomyces sp. NPDC006261 TaxID=3156739 RepID=UPI00339FF29C